MTSVKWNDREVYGWKRTLVKIYICIVVPIFMVLGMLFFVLALLLLPIMLPLHFILRWLGFRGFFYSEEPGSFSYTIGPGAFKRV